MRQKSSYHRWMKNSGNNSIQKCCFIRALFICLVVTCTAISDACASSMEKPRLPGVPRAPSQLDDKYMAYMIRTIRRHWYPPKCEWRHHIVRFDMNRDGVVSNIKMVLKAGAKISDAAAQEAITKSSPFVRLSDKVAEPVRVWMRFDLDGGVRIRAGNRVYNYPSSPELKGDNKRDANPPMAQLPDKAYDETHIQSTVNQLNAIASRSNVILNYADLDRLWKIMEKSRLPEESAMLAVWAASQPKFQENDVYDKAFSDCIRELYRAKTKRGAYAIWYIREKLTPTGNADLDADLEMLLDDAERLQQQRKS